MTHLPQPIITPNVVIESAKARKIIYTVFGIIALALAATSTGYAFAIGQGAIEDFPLWLGIANAVFPVVAAGVGFTARQNTPS